MEAVALFLPILCGFLNTYLTSACDYDADCHIIDRCCRVRSSDDGVCIQRDTCYGSCLEIDDCSAPEICDTYRNLCTTECSYSYECHHGYICDDGHCVSDEESTDSEFNISSLIFIFVGIMACILLICCCAVKHWRRLSLGGRTENVNRASRVVFTNRTSRGTNEQQNGEAGRLEMSTPVPHINVGSSEEIADPIAQDAPPSYDVVNSQPESPPPSYEEVMRASHEILPRNEHEHQV